MIPPILGCGTNQSTITVANSKMFEAIPISRPWSHGDIDEQHLSGLRDVFELKDRQR